MAHFIYEYSANLSEELLNMSELMEKMHAAAANSQIFPLAGIRSRAMKCEHFRVADGEPTKGFINLSMKVGRGRDEQTRMALGEMLWQVMLDHLVPLMSAQPVTVSYEMRELEGQIKFNHRNF